MLTVLAFYFGNRFGQVFDFNTMEITDGALATVNSIVAAPAAISTASVPMLYAIGLAITVLIVWLYTFMYAGNYRYGEEAGSAKWGTLKEGVAFKDQSDPSNNLLFTKNYGLALKKPKFDLEHDRNLNVMVIGGSGSGKTRNYVKPNLILEGYVRDYAVPFGNVYHLDSPGYVSEERWCDTLPSDRERSTFMALQNGVSTKEIIEHKDEFGWIDRMAMSSVADDYAECYMTQAGPDYLDEQEIMNVREQYPELIDSNGEIVWNDPDFVKRGVTFDVENFGEKYKIELVCDSYLDNGSLYVGAYDVTPESDNFGERWADISVNLNNPCQNDRTVFLDMNNLYNPAIIEAIYGLGTVEDIVSHSGSCSYPAFTFDADVISQMRNTQEFMDANTPDDYKLVAVKVGYNFALVPKIELSGIETNATETIVDISGKQYGLLAGRTFEDSQKLDAVLDMFPEYAIKDYKVPNKISVFIMPVQMYWKDDPSEIIETNFSFEDTCGLIIDDSVTFSGYTQNELVDIHIPSRIAQMAITEHIFQPTMANVNKLKRNRKAISKRLSSIIG